MGDPQKSESRREIPTDILPDILARLPTKDFVRSSCVCKVWCSIITGPSFRKLHVAHHAAAAASSEPEVLLVTETRELGRSDEASFFNLSCTKALSQVAIPSGYCLGGVCNDLLCFVLDHDQAPAIVCNPVTGETLQLPKAPPLPAGGDLSHLFVLGFNPPTNEYKMFRLSFPRWHETNYIAVYTLGGGGGGDGGWRQRSYLSLFHPVKSPGLVHIDGNIFVSTASIIQARAARMLVLDVATETPRFYRIPYNYNDYHESWEMVADGFDLNGQMYLVVNVGFYPCLARRPSSVMKPPSEIDGKDNDDDNLYWDQRYSFFLDGPFTFNKPRGAWIDHAKKLCYRVGNYVYSYDTRGYFSSSNVVDSLSFDERLELLDSPCPSMSSGCLEFSWWSICGGYRPSLLSPLVFALPPSRDEKGKKRPRFEHTMLRALKVEVDEHMDGI